MVLNCELCQSKFSVLSAGLYHKIVKNLFPLYMYILNDYTADI